MTHSKREKLINKLLKECKEIRITKGFDYTLNSNDVNRNFKKVGEELGLSPEKVLWVYYRKHSDAIASYLKVGKLKGEPVDEKIKDLINYLVILYTLLKEK